MHCLLTFTTSFFLFFLQINTTHPPISNLKEIHFPLLVVFSVMDRPMRRKLFFAAFLVVAAAAVAGADAYSTVAGTVFCDQCKDGTLSLFDYPMNGMKVAVTCKDSSNGEVKKWGEETTNYFGSYSMRLEGTPDLSGCQAQVSGNGRGCGAVAGSPRNLTLFFRMFDLAMYSVDPLLTEPFQPTSSSCPTSSSPPTNSPTPVTSPPPVKRSPVPRLPPMPPVPFLEASACQYRDWTMPQHKCYWKVVTPDTKVGVVFGLVAERRYGTDMTLWYGMQGRGDPYRTLLREGITALLNSYNSLQFPYHPLAVIQELNLALMGSNQRQVLHTALRFMRANSGNNGKVSCRFTPCKSS